MSQKSEQKRFTNPAILGSAGLALSALAGLAGAGYYWLLKRPLPQTKGSLTLPGLQKKVEVLRDPWGVPHIYAQNEADLFFAQGFVHAQDRLWQMEFQRRLVAGRLSEIIGEQTIQIDRWLRILGLRRVTEEGVALLKPEVSAAMQAYAAGVNARIARGRLPVEFTLLRHQPEPWTVADSLSWVKMISWVLSVNWESEILRARLIARLGPELAAELEPDYFDRCPTILPAGIDYSHIGETALKRAEDARPFTGPPTSAGLGSNNWTLCGKRTISGAPIFANDMHLPLSIPAIWYENHIECGEIKATGISFLGLPGIVSGHNGRVAWGFTNGFDDVQDLFMERLRHLPDGRVQYEFQGEWRDAQVIREAIKVKGGETEIEEVVVTHHGPIINSLDNYPAAEGEEQPLALRWVSLEPEATANTLYGILRARNCHEFHDSLRDWVAPLQNIVHADIEGNIAYSHPGHVPIRAKGDGTIPVPGWTGEYEWTGYIPFDELPHVINPDRGYIVTANNRIVEDDYPHFLTVENMVGADRAQRITELIEAQEKISVEYVKKMQFDQLSVVAREVKAYLDSLDVGDDAHLAAVLDLIRAWDGTLAASSPAAAVYQVFVRRMIYLTLNDKLGDLTIHYAGQGPTPGLADISNFGSRSWMWLEETLANPHSHWFDQGSGETRDDIMRLALGETVDYLSAELGPDSAAWAWGKLHKLIYSHPLGQVKPLDRLFNRGPYPLGGDGTTIWMGLTTQHDLSNPGAVGPPFRFIADLSDLRNSWGLLTPGNSGHPASKHYDDQVQAWFNAGNPVPSGYHPMLYDRADVDRHAQAALILTPL
jgi:penicillin G amidase